MLFQGLHDSRMKLHVKTFGGSIKVSVNIDERLINLSHTAATVIESPPPSNWSKVVLHIAQKFCGYDSTIAKVSESEHQLSMTILAEIQKGLITIMMTGQCLKSPFWQKGLSFALGKLGNEKKVVERDAFLEHISSISASLTRFMRRREYSKNDMDIVEEQLQKKLDLGFLTKRRQKQAEQALFSSDGAFEQCMNESDKLKVEETVPIEDILFSSSSLFIDCI